MLALTLDLGKSAFSTGLTAFSNIYMYMCSRYNILEM